MTIAATLALLVTTLTPDAALRPVTPVASVDLTRYAGRWYEIARYPNWFQKKCAREVTAEYVLGADSRITVINQCRTTSGEMTKAQGVARLATPGGPSSKLKVRFAPAFLSFVGAVWGDYWVLGLSSDYSYAVVGDPSREYLWVLSRTPTLDEASWQKVYEVMDANGFDRARLVQTVQTP